MKRSIGTLRSQAAAISAGHDLTKVYLARATFDGGINDVASPYQMEVSLNLSHRRTDGFVETLSSYVVRAVSSAAGESQGAIAWSAEIDCVAQFQTLDREAAVTEEGLEAFALLVGAPILHPYARELVQDLTGRSPYPAFTLGLLTSLTDLPDSHEIDLERSAP